MRLAAVLYFAGLMVVIPAMIVYGLTVLIVLSVLRFLEIPS